MRALLARVRARYGASPLHLLALLASFALVGYAVRRASLGPLPVRMGVWFVACAVGHDLIVLPLYALADRSLLTALRRGRRRELAAVHGVPVVNHIRIPALFSGLLLLVFAPVITAQGERFYHNASGLTEGLYLDRWLLATGVLFAVSAVAYALRLGVAVHGGAA